MEEVAGKWLVILMNRQNACAKFDICVSFFLFGVVKIDFKGLIYVNYYF